MIKDATINETVKIISDMSYDSFLDIIKNINNIDEPMVNINPIMLKFLINYICAHAKDDVVIKVINYYAENKHNLTCVDMDGNMPIHHICKRYKLNVKLIECIVENYDVVDIHNSFNSIGENIFSIICQYADVTK